MEGKKSYSLIVNGAQYEVPLSSLTGGQIRALAGAPGDWTLILEGKGTAADAIVKDEDEVSLASPPILYLTAPTMFG